MRIISEPPRETPVAHECDLCVIGGSCTGVFAAVRAARLGLSVTLVEQNVLLGGMATGAQVNEWHSLDDLAGTRPIIAGLTKEMLNRLKSRGAARAHPHPGGLRHRFNSAELAMELDELVRENHITLFLRGLCVGGARDGRTITAAIIEDKSGRRAIGARFFIDASGDGDLLRRTGLAAWRNPALQPVNYQILVDGLDGRLDGLWDRIRPFAGEFGYPLENATPWFFDYPSPAGLVNVFGARLNSVDASNADQATAAILEGRRRHRALIQMIRKGLGAEVTAVAIAHALGVRETWHARCLHRISAGELLSGYQFHDAIAKGTYPLDVHSPEGTMLRYLDGSEHCVESDGSITKRRWRSADIASPECYEIPYRSLVPDAADNLLVAGRLLDADREAFGGVRVMVNMNQTGEAAGVAAWLALKTGRAAASIPPLTLQQCLTEGGSLLAPKASQTGG
ncbi:FAD-dependent oxidoreductase [soil metagenome]